VAQTPVVEFPAAWAYWKMEEASGNRVDSSGNGRDLSDTGGNPMLSGPGIIDLGMQSAVPTFPYCIYCEVARSDESFDGSAGFSVALWLQLSPSPDFFLEGVSTLNTEVWFQGYTPTFEDGFTFNLRVLFAENYGPGIKGLVTMELNRNNYTEYLSAYVFDCMSYDILHFLVFTYNNATTTSTIKLDNVLIYTDSTQLNIPPIVGMFTVDVNVNSNRGPTNSAIIDEYSIWDRPLTDQNISDLYNSGAGWSPY
jgi:hypothetical protein